jgi:SAM-dependent methyltransferase
MEQQIYQQLYDLEDRHWWFRGRREVIRALIDRAGLPDRPAILDAGCGTGRNLIEFGTPATAFGIDPSQDAIDFCRRRGLDGVELGELERLPFDDGRFDLVMACDVIEHVDDDAGALRELRRVAKPDGRLLVTVPAYEQLWSQHDDHHQHRRRYTLGQLRRRVEGSGWAVRDASYFNTTLLAPIALVRAVRRGEPIEGETSDYDLTPPWANRLLELPMRGEASMIRRGRSLPAGLSIGMVCEAR